MTAVTTDTKPFAAFEWMMALRYLRSRRKKSVGSVIALFSFIGIVIAVMALIVVMAVLNGFRKDLFHKILGLQGHVIVMPVSGYFTDYAEATTRVKTLPGVRNVVPTIDGQALASAAHSSNGVVVRGVPEGDLKQLGAISSKIRFGTLDGFDQGDGVVIGVRLANIMRTMVGDEITLVGPRGASTPFGTAPRVKRYTVRAIFETGMPDYDRAVVFMPVVDAQKFFNVGAGVQYLEILVDNPDAVETVKGQITKALGPNLLISDWREKSGHIYDALTLERKVAFVVLTLIMLVASLNIVSGLIVLVKDKGRDIAILRTMGATRGTIMRVFFITGASVGIVGTLVGLALGVLICVNVEPIHDGLSWLFGGPLFNPRVYYLDKLPVNMDLTDVSAVIILTLSLSLLATIYPAWRAARLDPVEALRHE